MGRDDFQYAGNGVSDQDLSHEHLLDALPTDNKGHPRIGGISLKSKLGQGGMSSVYLGRHPRLDIDVAVKIFPQHLADADPAKIKRFFSEAKLAARVMSTHIVNVLDVHEDYGIFYIVMEYVDGITAGHLLRKLKSGYPELPITVDDLDPAPDSDDEFLGVPEWAALSIIIGATEGLNSAHEYDVIHRDIKPDNILIPRHRNPDEKGALDLAKAKLSDLGLAKPEQAIPNGTLSTAGLGTPGYLAPEQIMDARSVSKMTDVFGMGAALYTLLAGRSPFQGIGVGDLIRKTLKKPHTPIQELCPRVSVGVSDVLDRCLAKAPSERYPDAAALLDALRQAQRLSQGNIGTGDAHPLYAEGESARIEIGGLGGESNRNTDSAIPKEHSNDIGSRRHTGRLSTGKRRRISGRENSARDSGALPDVPLVSDARKRVTTGRRSTGKRHRISGRENSARNSGTLPDVPLVNDTRKRAATGKRSTEKRHRISSGENSARDSGALPDVPLVNDTRKRTATGRRSTGKRHIIDRSEKINERSDRGATGKRRRIKKTDNPVFRDLLAFLNFMEDTTGLSRPIIIGLSVGSIVMLLAILVTLIILISAP